jgi:hypothetical protein
VTIQKRRVLQSTYGSLTRLLGTMNTSPYWDKPWASSGEKNNSGKREEQVDEMGYQESCWRC